MSQPTATALRPPSRSVDPRCRPWWAVQTASWIGAPLLVLGVLGLLIEPARPWFWVPAAVLLVLGVVLTPLVPLLRHRVHRWEATDEAVYSRHGWLVQEWRAAPLNRVQTIDVSRGPLQRLFGLASVRVTTASSRGAVVVEALAEQEAEDLAHRLTPLTAAVDRDEDAT